MEHEEEGPRSFAVLLREMGEGAVLAEANEELFKIIKLAQDEASDSNVPADVTFTLKLGFKAHPNGMVDTKYDIKSTPPKRRHGPVILYTTKDGNLTVRNPKQHELPLREVSGGCATVRDFGSEKEIREL